MGTDQAESGEADTHSTTSTPPESLMPSTIQASSATKSSLPPYLHNNSWEEELNYKLWVTSSSRFRADKRCSLQGRWSQWAVTLLTSYLIILGILPLLPQPLGKLFPPDVLSFATTAVSIVLLAYSLIEAGKDYSLKAHRYHECALRVGRLYTRLRRAKEIGDVKIRAQEINDITEEYQTSLEVFENHEPIDYATFQTTKAAYFKLSAAACRWIWFRYYCQTLLIYHVLISAPPLLITLLLRHASVSEQ